LRMPLADMMITRGSTLNIDGRNAFDGS